MPLCFSILRVTVDSYFLTLFLNLGVEKVQCDADSNKLTVIGKVDPVMLREKVEQKTHKHVELVSPVPKKGGKEKDGGGGGGGGGGGAEEKKKQNKENKDPKENKGGGEDNKKSKVKEVL